MRKSIRHELLELSEAVDNELFPIEAVKDYIGELCIKAGEEKPYAVIELTYKQLFNIEGSMQSSIDNIKRVMKEQVENSKLPGKQKEPRE